MAAESQKDPKLSKGAQTRQSILAAGIALAAKEGAHRISMRKVAERVHLSPMAIYRHFEDKAALQGAMLVEAFRVFELYLEESRSEAGGVEGLKNLADGFVRFALAKPGHFELLFLSISNPRQNVGRRLVKDAGKPTFSLLRDALGSCLESGELISDDLELLTLDTLAFCIGHAALLLSGNIEVSKKQAIQDFAAAFDRHLAGKRSG